MEKEYIKLVYKNNNYHGMLMDFFVTYLPNHFNIESLNGRVYRYFLSNFRLVVYNESYHRREDNIELLNSMESAFTQMNYWLENDDGSNEEVANLAKELYDSLSELNIGTQVYTRLGRLEKLYDYYYDQVMNESE